MYTQRKGKGNLKPSISTTSSHVDQRSEFRFRWLMLARVNLNAVLVERPERVPE
jgi:hypothetical protein